MLAVGGAAFTAPAAHAEPEAGGTVWVGPKEGGYGGTGLWPAYIGGPPGSGDPDFWLYCLENRVSALSNLEGTVGADDDFLGSNHFADPAAQGKVRWVLAHSYPALSLEDFAAAAGLPSISRADAIEAAQYAIWRYTDLSHDASWSWETSDSESAYWYLVDGANASGGMSQADFETTVAVTAPSGPQTAGSLVGPFTIATNQAVVRVLAESGHAIVDAAGSAIDAEAVVDGQQLYLDLRGSSDAGSATLSAFAQGSSATGLIVSAPGTPGGALTPGDHSQTRILVAAFDTETEGSAVAQWSALAAPSIGTSLATPDSGKTVPAEGGVVIDTIAYEGLEAGAEYTVFGELMLKRDGSATGVIGSAAFIPTQTDGAVEVSFSIPAGYAGEELVAFERLYQGGYSEEPSGVDPVAAHEDLDDAAQTVSVEEDEEGEEVPIRPVPAITTSLRDAVDGDRVLPWNGGVVVDTVAYKGLVPGVEHTVSGELMLKSDGSETAITASMTFTPAAAQGEVELSFTVPEGYAGEQLVAFEWLFGGGGAGDRGDAIATHTDIDDAAQTVTIQQRPAVPVDEAPAAPTEKPRGLERTGSSLAPAVLGASGLLVAVGGASLMLARRRAKGRG